MDFLKATQIMYIRKGLPFALNFEGLILRKLTVLFGGFYVNPQRKLYPRQVYNFVMSTF